MSDTQQPTIGRIVHYVSYGTPGGEYRSACRAAVVTAVAGQLPHGEQVVSLAVLNPEGMFFNKDVRSDDGSGEPGRADCPAKETHANPFRSCPCGWQEPQHKGGTWHWPERE